MTKIVTISINNGYGVSAPVEIIASTDIDHCEGEDKSLYVSLLDGFSFGPYNDTLVVCEVGCTRLDLNLPVSIINSISVNWSPGIYLDDSTSLYPTICDPDSNIVYNVELAFSDGSSSCVYEALFPINVSTRPFFDIFTDGYACLDSFWFAPEDYENYNWFKIDDATGIATPIQGGSDNAFSPVDAG